MLTFTTIVDLAMVLVVRVILARTFGPVLIGDYYVAISGITIASRWGSLGIISSAQLQIRGSDGQLRRSRGIAIGAIALGLSLAAIVYTLASLLPAEWRRFVDVMGVHWFACSAAVALLAAVGGSVLLGAGQAKRYMFVMVGGNVILALAACMAALFPSVRLSDVLWISTATWAGQFVIAFASLQRGEKQLTIRELYSYGLRCWPNVVANVGFNRLNVLLMTTALPLKEVGVVAVAMNICDAVAAVLSSGAPLIMNATRASNGSGAKAVTKNVRAIVFIGAGTCLLLGLTGEHVIRVIWGAEFAESHLYLKFLCPVIVLSSINRIHANALYGMRKPESVLFAQIAGMCVIAICYTQLKGADAAAVTGGVLASSALSGWILWRAVGSDRRGCAASGEAVLAEGRVK